MFVTNQHYYGHLLNTESYDTSRTAPDFYQLIDNQLVSKQSPNSDLITQTHGALLVAFFSLQDWEYRYIHEDYHHIKLPDTKIEEV